MKQYTVRFLYTTHVDITVQASSEDAARIKANNAMLNMSDMALAENLLNNRNLDGTEVED